MLTTDEISFITRIDIFILLLMLLAGKVRTEGTDEVVAPSVSEVYPFP